MKYVYRNISGVTAVSLIQGVNIGNSSSKASDLITVHKCRIANTYSSSITVDVYIQAIDQRATIKLYGPDSDVDITKEYYYIKDLVIPTGTAVNVFGDIACTYSREYSLKVQLETSNDTADIAVSYETIAGTTPASRQREINQY